MKQATFRFYEELNDFLPRSKKKVAFTHHFLGNPTVRDVIAAIGVPHTEIDLILANNQSVSFDYHVQADDRIAVYPVFEAMDISPVTLLRAKPLRITQFILDSHLGKLAKYLRMMGFDAVYDNHFADKTLVLRSLAEHRIILTKDRDLLKHKRITHGYWVRSTDPKQQVQEILTRFDLKDKINAFSRCLACNTPLQVIEKDHVHHLLPTQTRERFEQFLICSHCNKVYWEGSHFSNMKKTISDFVQGIAPSLRASSSTDLR